MVGQHLAIAQQESPPEDLSGLKMQPLISEGLGNTASSEIKLRREVPSSSLMAWSQCRSRDWTEVRDKGSVLDCQSWRTQSSNT